MKITRKALSILLVVAMLLTSLSVGFMSFAAASDAQYNTLIAALKNDTVKNASFTTSSPTTGSGANKVTNYTSEITADADGKILAAVEAWWVVFKAEATATNTNTEDYFNRNDITANKVTAKLKTNLQSRMGATEFANYNVASFLDNLVGKANFPTSANTSTSNIPNGGTVTLTVTNPNALLAYDSISAMPANVTNKTVYQLVHRRAQYDKTTGSGCNATTTTYYFSAFATTNAAAWKTSTDTQATANLKTAYNNIVAQAAYFTTFANLVNNFTPDQLTAAKNAITTNYNTIVNSYGAAVYNKYVKADYDCETALANIASAIDASALKPTVDRIEEICAIDYSAYTSTQMNTLYQELAAKLAEYDKASSDTKNFFAADGFDRDAAGTYAAALLKAYELKKLAELKDGYDAAIATYSAITDAQVTGETPEISKTALTLYRDEIIGYINALGTYDAANVAAVFGADYVTDKLGACKAALENLMKKAGYNADVRGKYSEFVSTVYAAVDLTADSEDLLAALQKYDSWFTNVKALENSIKADIGADDTARLFGALIDAMTAKMNEEYAALGARIDAQVETAYEIFTAINGEDVTIINVGTFTAYTKAVANIETEIFDFLDASPNAAVKAETKEKYEELKKLALDEYEAFITSGGYAKYAEYDVPDIIREYDPAEMIRDTDYTVDDAKTNELVGLLDAALASDEFSALLGLDEKLDIAAKLHEMLKGMVFTDELVNTLVQYVYPIVAKEFAKVWADLPKTTPADNPLGGDQLEVTLQLDDLTTAMNTIKFFIFPGLLAENIKDQYPAVAEVLKKATTVPKYHMDTEVMDNPWEDAAICKEDGTLNLDWGINSAADEDKEAAFLNALQAALSGLEPLLLALVSNKGIDGKHHDNDNDIAKDGKPGHGRVGRGDTEIEVACVPISVDVDPINLFLDIAGNEGYNNAIVPILEALGLNPAAIPNGNNFTSVKQLAKEGLIDPIAALIDQLGAAPVDFLTKALPNLAYAIDAGRIVPLLKMLKTDINYHADAHYSAVGDLAAGDIPNALSDGPISINIGEMIDLEDMGLDISSFNALLNLVTGLLGSDDGSALNLPAIESGKLASMGKLVWKDTKRSAFAYNNLGNGKKAAYIEANQGDVLVALVRYLLKAIAADPTLIATLVDLIGSMNAEEPADPTAEPAEPAKPFELPTTVLEILGNIANNPDDAIAAIVELVFADQEYTGAPDYVEYEGTGYTDEEIAAAAEELGVTVEDVKAYLEENYGVQYSEDWTREKAEYVAEYLDVVVEDILLMFGVEIGGEKVETLSQLVSALLKEFITADTLNSLVDMIKGLFASDEEAAPAEEGALDLSAVLEILPTILDLTNVDLDLTAWDSMTFSFADGDFDAFVAGLKEIVAPLNDVVAFIAADEDIVLTMGEDLVKLSGYEGYKGVAPLINTLGGTAMSTDAYTEDPDNATNNLIDMVADAAQAIIDDPYNKLFDLIPAIFLYLQSDGLNVLIENLTYAIFEVIDIIKPIYPVNLEELLGIDLDGSIDPVSTLLAELNGMIEEATGVSLNVDFTAGEVLNEISAEADKADILTVVFRYLLNQLIFNGNATKIAKIARTLFNLDDAQYVFLFSLLYAIRYTNIDADGVLGVLFYVFFGAVQADKAALNAFKAYKYDWEGSIKTVIESLTGVSKDLNEEAQGAIDGGIGAIDATLTGLDAVKATIALVGDSWKNAFANLPKLEGFDTEALKGLDYEYIKNELIKEALEEYDDFAEEEDIPGVEDVKNFFNIFQLIKDFFAKILASFKKLFGM